MIRLMVCDDHDMVRTGLMRMLQADEGFEVVGEAASPVQLLERLQRDDGVDVLLLDLSLGAGGVPAGMALIDGLQKARPHIAVLVVSMHDDPELVGRALQAGARGYVTKESPIDVLHEAIRQVSQGRRFLDPHLVEPMIARHARGPGEPWDASLTPREREVLQMLCAGQRVSDIAIALSLSIKTVSTHKIRLMQKLDVTNNADLIKLGMRHGIST